MASLPSPVVPQWASLQPAPAVPDVLLEHVQEIGFLGIQRKALLFSTDVPLSGIHRHQARIDAHWDALMIAGNAAVVLALEHLEEFDPWESAAALRVWLELGAPDRGEVIARFDAAAPKMQGAWRQALRWLSSARLAALFPPSSAATEVSPALQSALIFAWGWHGLPADEPIARGAFAPETELRLQSARALAGPAGTQPNGASLLATLFSDAEVTVRRTALWSLAMQRPAAAAAQARDRISRAKADVFDVRALGLLGVPSDLAVVRPLLDSALAPAAARAIGDLGGPQGVEVLIEALAKADEALAVHLLEGLAGILGTSPEGFPQAGDGAPDAAVLRKWWESSKSAWSGSERWLRGKPFPWRGPVSEEPMLSLWRTVVLQPRAELDWLRREVPSFFFEDEPPGYSELGR